MNLTYIRKKAGLLLAILTVSSASAQVLNLTGQVRDFQAVPWAVTIPGGYETRYNPLFENIKTDSQGIVKGIVKENLVNGKPIYAHGTSNYVGQTPPAPYGWGYEGVIIGDNDKNARQNFNEMFGSGKTTVNRPTFDHTITLKKGGDGLYRYSNNAFFIADGKGYGNEHMREWHDTGGYHKYYAKNGNVTNWGNYPHEYYHADKDHNYGFTYEIHTTFDYNSSKSNLFSFRGDDDIWIFINGKLAIDLGGVHQMAEAVVDLNTGKVSEQLYKQGYDWNGSGDGNFTPVGGSQTSHFVNLELVSGKEYTLDIFYAERRSIESHFEMTTTFELENWEAPEPSTYGLIGAGVLLAGVAYTKRRNAKAARK
jgi:fibro-slime domain-containing protein